MVKLARWQALLSGLWAGMLLTVGGLAAPALFSVLDRSVAGLAAGRIFQWESRVSLALSMVLFLLERRRVRDLIEEGGTTSVLTPQVTLVLGALFLTVFGGFALQPMMQDAKAGLATPLSFAVLHGLSAALFWLKAALVLALAWRSTPR